jgi:high-affinity Fe2+/Pb2+ permease
LYFPITYAINHALPKYAASMPIVRLLLLATASIMLIQILHANYFRLIRRQRSMTAAACAGAGATLVCLLAVQHLHSLSAMAWATVAGCTIWCLLGELLLLRFMNVTAVSLVRTIAGLGLFMAIFLYASGQQHTLLTGFAIQLVLTVVATLVVFLPTLRSLRKVVLARFGSAG